MVYNTGYLPDMVVFSCHQPVQKPSREMGPPRSGIIHIMKELLRPASQTLYRQLWGFFERGQAEFIINRDAAKLAKKFKSKTKRTNWAEFPWPKASADGMLSYPAFEELSELMNFEGLLLEESKPSFRIVTYESSSQKNDELTESYVIFQHSSVSL